MAARGGGSIVNVSTFGASVAGQGGGIYGASKAALELLNRPPAASRSARRNRRRHRLHQLTASRYLTGQTIYLDGGMTAA